ncbi:hypothetical protein Ciccas_005136 [Cichlidogyrus casuarinus]|uniref:Uncharacterized protein n=1 Tax=Cichlidogyrus casuarinus TaxID=1844966 RepID=A0ABD2Q9Q9_9PLAT
MAHTSNDDAITLESFKAMEETVKMHQVRRNWIDNYVIKAFIEWIQSNLGSVLDVLKCDFTSVEDMKKLSKEQLNRVDSKIQAGMNDLPHKERRSKLLIFGLPVISKEYDVLKEACSKAGLPRLHAARRFGKEQKDNQDIARLRPVRLTFNEFIPRQKCCTKLKVAGMTYNLVCDKNHLFRQLMKLKEVAKTVRSSDDKTQQAQKLVLH